MLACYNRLNFTNLFL